MKFNLMTLLVLSAVVFFIGLMLYQNNKKGVTTSSSLDDPTCWGCSEDRDCGDSNYYCDLYNARCPTPTGSDGGYCWPKNQ